MGIVHGDTSSYKVRSILPRQDGDGREWLLCRAHGDLTAATFYSIYMRQDGWVTAALADTTLASTSAAAAAKYYVGVPRAAIGSDTDGWLQIGGVATSVGAVSQSCTTGNYLIWSDATVTGALAFAATNPYINCFAIVMTTASSGTYDVYLTGYGHMLCGTT